MEYAGYFAHGGEYVGQNQGDWTNRDVPIQETAFRSASERSKDWPWATFLGDEEQVLVNHRRVLAEYKKRR